ncbi:MAG: hypothetical protein Kow0037_00060 [Calditrichia bacterium]
MRRVLPVLLLIVLNTFAAERKVVTIFPFHFATTNLQEKAALAELNNFFYDLFAGQLAATEYFEVVDRQNMQALLEEIALQQSGLTEKEVIRMGKMKGAQLAIFGTVTKIGKQTFLTMKIIDIETSVILRAIKQKGSLNNPDILATEAGLKFMNGLSHILQKRYQVVIPTVPPNAQKGLKELFKARDLIQQAIVLAENDQTKEKSKLLKNAEKHLQAAEKFPELKTIVENYREEINEIVNY